MTEKTYENLEVTILDGKTYVGGSDSDLLIHTAASKFIKPSEKNFSYCVFDRELKEDDRFVSKEKVIEEVIYNLSNPSTANPNLKKVLDEETYEELPASIQKLYTKKASYEDSYVPRSHGMVLTNLDQIGETEPEVIFYNSERVARALINMNFRTNKRVRIDSPGYFSGVKNGLEVYFFAHDYDGKMEKRYDKKKNGQIYADRRGRMVPVYPDVVSKIRIPLSFVPSFISHSKEESQEKLQEIFDHFGQTALLPIAE